jgi:hypothetical protein
MGISIVQVVPDGMRKTGYAVGGGKLEELSCRVLAGVLCKAVQSMRELAHKP